MEGQTGLRDDPRLSRGPAPRAPVPPPLGTSHGGLAGTSDAPTRPATGEPGPTSRSTAKAVGRTTALALLLFVTVVLVLFVVFNTQTVDISLVFGNVDAPLVLALLIAAVLGALMAALAQAVLRARRRNR
ncbi:LapA family protein [Blastococcus sp. KM273129]|nr:LapA family protein [Blastococcus sp. KM273129]